MHIRRAEESELADLATLWYQGWQEAHKPILPPELARFRTLESFHLRLRSAEATLRTTGPIGRPQGLCLIKHDELSQLYVSAEARGTGVAAALLADGEARLSAAGVETAWLGCAVGNDRAARFYEKHGWRLIGKRVIPLETSEQPFPLEAWRYEKDLAAASISRRFR